MAKVLWALNKFIWSLNESLEFLDVMLKVSQSNLVNCKFSLLCYKALCSSVPFHRWRTLAPLNNIEQCLYFYISQHTPSGGSKPFVYQVPLPPFAGLHGTLSYSNIIGSTQREALKNIRQWPAIHRLVWLNCSQKRLFPEPFGIRVAPSWLSECKRGRGSEYVSVLQRHSHIEGIVHRLDCNPLPCSLSHDVRSSTKAAESATCRWCWALKERFSQNGHIIRNDQTVHNIDDVSLSPPSH